MDGVEFVDEPFTITIKQGNAICSYSNGVRRAFPLAVFRQDVARANKALAEFDARKGVVPIRANG
jgi:hypothetical protein